ncbi:MAG: GTP-binding protein, partial [Coprobacillus sp.]
ENKNSLQEVLLKEANICPTCEHHEHHHGHHHHHHDADEIFTSIGKETIHTYTLSQLETILEMLSTSPEFGSILRAKGVLQSPDKTWLHFDLVPGEYEVREGSADYTGRLCVIGSQMNEKKIEELFGVK